MKLIVFGATGMVGKELVKQALYNGHEVKAFGRNVFVENLPDNKNLELVQGALFDESDVSKAMKGCDAVLSAIGGATNDSDKTRSLGIKNIVKQMQKTGIKRIVALGGLGVLKRADDKPVMDQEDFPPAYYAVSVEHKKALETLQASDLDWTFVCPPNIKEGVPTGLFQVAAERLPEPNNFSIYSGDIALFMLKEVERNTYLKQPVGISS